MSGQRRGDVGALGVVSVAGCAAYGCIYLPAIQLVSLVGNLGGSLAAVRYLRWLRDRCGRRLRWRFNGWRNSRLFVNLTGHGDQPETDYGCRYAA